MVTLSAKEDPANWGWEVVRNKTLRSGTEYEFVEAGCQYCNGLAERRVMVLKRTLDHLLTNTLVLDNPTLNYAELQVLMQLAANITNYRSGGLHKLTDDKLVTLTE